MTRIAADRPIFYKGCVITRTTTYTSIPARFGGTLRFAPLYDITGTVTKPARPFITSIAEAKRYITQEIDARTYGRMAQEVPTP